MGIGDHIKAALRDEVHRDQRDRPIARTVPVNDAYYLQLLVDKMLFMLPSGQARLREFGCAGYSARALPAQTPEFSDGIQIGRLNSEAAT
jgi:hypothetical protein